MEKATKSKEKDTTKTAKIDITKKEPIDKNMDKVPSGVKKVVSKKTTVKSSVKNLGDIAKKYNTIAIVMIALALFILSFIVAAQLNTVGNTDIISAGMREAELLQEVQRLNNEYKILKENYEKSQEIVEEYKTSASTNDILIASMKTELERANILAGLVDVKGQGIIVTLEDSTSEDLPAESKIIHDTDLRAIVTELKAAGAEAISINGQRIVTTTAIRCVGPTIQINSVKVASPFYIKAIGNAKYLESALSLKNGVLDSLSIYGFRSSIETSDNITIGKYDSNFKFEYATKAK